MIDETRLRIATRHDGTVALPDVTTGGALAQPGLLAAAAVLLLLSCPGIGAAAGTDAALACMPIESAQARLDCYDRALGRSVGEMPGMNDPLEAVDPADLDHARADPALRSSDLYVDEGRARRRGQSLLDRRWELHPDARLGTFNLRAHRPVVVLPLFFGTRPNQTPSSPNPLNNVETPLDVSALENKFQLSFKTKVLEGLFRGHGDLWFGFTQSSRWQLYSGRASRPFRETNYEPEVMLVFGGDLGLLAGWRARMLGIGFAHQSNGRSLPLSRSWDRTMLNIGIERDNWVIELRPWWRIPEGRSGDDNPDIEDHLGRGELRIVHSRGDHELALMMRHSLRSGDRSRGAVQLDWSFPLHRHLRGHVQLFDGYGESMIDYNHRATYLGLGMSLLRWY